MKHNVTFLKRCLALVLALVMIASNANLGLALNAFAVENTEKTVTLGELVANDHPELTEAEKAFLKSGLLADDYDITYYTPSEEDGLVTIDVANKTIVIDDYYHQDTDYRYAAWTPVQVRIIANNTVVEVIEKFGYDSNNAVYTAAYSYAGEAFTVEVDLELTEHVDKWSQYYMLNAAADIKGAMANLAALEAVDTELGTVATAVPALSDVIAVADKVSDVSYDFMDAVDTLQNQIDLDGTLTLCALNKVSEPNAKGVNNYAGDYEEALYETYWALYDIQNDELYNNTILTNALKLQDPEVYTQWVAFKGVLADLMVVLEKVLNDPWSYVYNNPLYYNLSDAEYARVDLLLSAIENPTVFSENEVADKDFLVDAVTLRESRDLVSVTINVVLMNVENAVDSDKLVTVGKNTVVLDFPENAHDYDVENAVYDKGVIDNAIASFGDAYADGHFEVEWSELPERLTEDTTLTITFAPKDYWVDIATDDEVIELGFFPYGYQMTLPSHEDAANKAYDYTIDGKLYRQGEIYTVVGDTMITRDEVKAYTVGSLYAIIGDCFGNAGAQAVLTSGALKGDVMVYYREPNVEEGDLWLEDNWLTVAASYTSGYTSYHGNALWIPYSYGLNDTVNYFANNQTAVDWDGRSVNVTYKLPLADQTAKAAEVAAIVNTIYADYVGQKAGMDSLLGKKGDVEQLTKMYLSGLKGIIGDFTFVDDPTENQELRDYFTGVISKIQANCVTDGSGYLDILAMIKGYEANGMSYYYKNSKLVADEVAELSSYLTELVGDPDKQAALAKLLCDPGVARPELVEKIGGLEESMATIADQLELTHEAIDVDSDNLTALIKALETAGGVTVTASGAPFVISDEIAVQDESAVVLKAEIFVNGKKHTVQGTEIDKYSALTSAMIAELQELVDAYLDATLGENAKYYNVVNNVTTDLNWYLGEELTNNLTVTVTADAKQYTVKIDGEADQVITINKLDVKLPAYVNEGDVKTYSYVYTIDGVEYEDINTSYTFTTEQIDRLFVDGTYTIDRIVRDEAARRLAAALEALNNNTAGNTYYVEDGTLYANISTNGAGVQAFATGLLASGYSYIGMNGEGFLYENAEGELEISIQTLVNALLNDETFSEQTVIDLGNNNGGKALITDVQLGNDPETLYSKLGFVINLNSVPSQMVDVAKALNALENNLHFYSDNGILVTELTLPEKVYEVYLTAMLAVGEVDTDDMNAINNEIAFMYVYDYINLVLGNENITTQTFQNTLEKLDAAANLVGKDLPNKDLTAYESAYQAIRSIFNSVDVTVNADAPVELDVTATSEGLNKIINGLGVDMGAYELYMGMLKELKPGNTLEATATVTLTNTTVDFEALVIDLDEGIEGAKDAVDAVRGGQDDIIDEAKDNVKGNGLANSIDYTTDLFGRAAELNGPAAIYLLDDVTGDLVINHTTVLDLNGKTINGNVTVNGGKLVIVDSKIATSDCGTVTGSVSGNVTIIAGNYPNANVTAYLRDGYTQVNGTVQNAMYTVEREGKDFNLILNSDFMEEAYVDGYLPSVAALAAEIAVDTALNFYIPANLNVDGNRIYGIDDRYNDLIALTNLSAGELVDQVLAGVGVEGMAALVNTIIDDLMQFGAVADAIENDQKIVSYTFETNPWAVEFMHAAEGDYMTVGIVADDEVSRDVTISLTVVGDNAKRVVALLRELDKIVVYDETDVSIDLKQPVRDGKHIVLEGGATAHLSLDLTVHGEDQFDHDDYKNILAVIFAYGNPEKADALISAIGSDTELNAAFNDMTVREIIKALGAMQRTTSFTEMASAVGAADLVSDSADDLEALYHLIACAAGKVLAKLESMNINGIADRAENAAEKALDKLELTTLKPVLDKAGNVIDRVLAKVDLDSKLGALDQGDGTYLLYYAYERSGSVDYRGFGADLTLSETSGMLKVKIFDEEDCLWGDANHDGLVNAMDATLVLQYSVDTLAADQFFCTLRTDVNGDGDINAMDATLILQHSVGTITKFPVEE